MLIVMHHSATDQDVALVKQAVESLGYKPVAMPGAARTAICVIGNQGWVDEAPFAEIPGILELIHVTKPYKLVSRDFHQADTVVKLGRGVSVGGPRSPLFMAAGPCAIESHEQLLKTARYLKKLGVPALRGGAYKPRTSPHSFQGMREEGVRIMSDVGHETGILTVTEVMSPEHVGFVAEHIDVLQIGARNMQNFDLLKEVGLQKKPVILKRGLSATLEEWVASAEYIMFGGNSRIVLCERGIRTFETATRNTADLAVIPLIKGMTHLPVIFDPSHATGHRPLVAPMALAAVTAGAHGLMIEVHPDPEHATSDGPQSLHFNEFRALFKKIQILEDFVRKNKLLS
jgi:3-deoxy-7-phosphoheptulonate synthase